jgi:hypothetical protein
MLGGAVRLRDVRLGEVEDLLVDVAGLRVLGFAVLCGDHGRRLLPVAAAELGGPTVRVESALVLMEESFYRARAQTLTELGGSPVVKGGDPLGPLADVLFDDEGAIRLVNVQALGLVPVVDGVAVTAGVRTPAV